MRSRHIFAALLCGFEIHHKPAYSRLFQIQAIQHGINAGHPEAGGAEDYN